MASCKCFLSFSLSLISNSLDLSLILISMSLPFLSLFNPSKMLLGLLAMCLAVCLFMYANNSSPSLSEFKKSHPLISLLLIFAVGYVIVYLFSSVLVFLMGILLPTVMMFLHSLLRTRNLKNKITNKMENIGLSKKTPMGLLLQSFGSDDE